MSKKLNITISDYVFSQIEDKMEEKGVKNKSEFVEELIRTGLNAYEGG